MKVVKNKVAPPFKTAEFDILFGTGISREGGLIDLGVEQNIVRKSGAWYTYEGDQLGQGKENARNFLRDNPDLANEIEKKIKEKLGVGARLDAEAADKEPASGAGLRAVPNAAAGGGSRGCGCVRRPGCHQGHRRARWCWVASVARDRDLPGPGRPQSPERVIRPEGGTGT